MRERALSPVPSYSLTSLCLRCSRSPRECVRVPHSTLACAKGDGCSLSHRKSVDATIGLRRLELPTRQRLSNGRIQRSPRSRVLHTFFLRPVPISLVRGARWTLVAPDIPNMITTLALPSCGFGPALRPSLCNHFFDLFHQRWTVIRNPVLDGPLDAARVNRLAVFDLIHARRIKHFQIL